MISHDFQSLSLINSYGLKRSSRRTIRLSISIRALSLASNERMRPAIDTKNPIFTSVPINVVIVGKPTTRYSCCSVKAPPSIRRDGCFQRFPRFLHQLHVQAQRLELADQDVEAFRDARLGRGFSFHDGFVNLGASVHVVGLGG